MAVGIAIIIFVLNLISICLSFPTQQSSQDLIIADRNDLDLDAFLNTQFISSLANVSNDDNNNNNIIINHTRTHVRRQCTINRELGKWICDDEMPTMSQLVEQLQEKPGGMANRGRHASFYVNLDDPSLARGKDESKAWLVGWMRSRGLEGKYYWWADSVDRYWLEAQAQHLRDNKDKMVAKGVSDPVNIFLNCFMQALALATDSPDAYFFTKKGVDWDKDTIWNKVEYPSLTRNPRVQRILRIDPRPPNLEGIKPEEQCKDNNPELLWSRQRRDPRPPLLWSCPYLT